MSGDSGPELSSGVPVQSDSTDRRFGTPFANRLHDIPNFQFPLSLLSCSRHTVERPSPAEPSQNVLPSHPVRHCGSGETCTQCVRSRARVLCVSDGMKRNDVKRVDVTLLIGRLAERPTVPRLVNTHRLQRHLDRTFGGKKIPAKDTFHAADIG